jgi:hypothetical protein
VHRAEPGGSGKLSAWLARDMSGDRLSRVMAAALVATGVVMLRASLITS